MFKTNNNEIFDNNILHSEEGKSYKSRHADKLMEFKKCQRTFGHSLKN